MYCITIALTMATSIASPYASAYNQNAVRDRSTANAQEIIANAVSACTKGKKQKNPPYSQECLAAIQAISAIDQAPTKVAAADGGVISVGVPLFITISAIAIWECRTTPNDVTCKNRRSKELFDNVSKFGSSLGASAGNTWKKMEKSFTDLFNDIATHKPKFTDLNKIRQYVTNFASKHLKAEKVPTERNVLQKLTSVFSNRCNNKHFNPLDEDPNEYLISMFKEIVESYFDPTDIHWNDVVVNMMIEIYEYWFKIGDWCRISSKDQRYDVIQMNRIDRNKETSEIKLKKILELPKRDRYSSHRKVRAQFARKPEVFQGETKLYTARGNAQLLKKRLEQHLKWYPKSKYKVFIERFIKTLDSMIKKNT
jgi:hypothetical protein